MRLGVVGYVGYIWVQFGLVGVGGEVGDGRPEGLKLLVWV